MIHTPVLLGYQPTTSLPPQCQALAGCSDAWAPWVPFLPLVDLAGPSEHLVLGGSDWFGEVFTPKDLISSEGTLGWLGIRQTWNPLLLRPRIKEQLALAGQG